MSDRGPQIAGSGQSSAVPHPPPAIGGQPSAIRFSRRTELLLKAAMVLSGPLLLLLLLEGISYFWERNQANGLYAWELVASRRIEMVEYPEPLPGYTKMKAGQEYLWQGIPVRINPHGLRGPETTYEKPEGTYRILNLGDSVAMGWGVDVEETYGRQLEDRLNRDASANEHYEVINAGVPGWNPENELAYLQAEGMQYQPDLVLYDLTIVNDVYGANALQKDRQPPLQDWLRANTYFWPFLSIQMQWMQARTAGRERIDVIDPPTEAAKYFPLNANAERWDKLWESLLAMDSLAAGQGAEFVLLLFPLEYQVVDENYSTLPQELLVERAQEAGMTVIDLLPVYQEACRAKPEGRCQLEDRYLFADVWMHPSPYGHTITTEAILTTLQTVLP